MTDTNDIKAGEQGQGKLKPCPFCGGIPRIIKDAENKKAVRCTHCFITASEPEWIYAWAHKRIAELEAKIADLEKKLKTYSLDDLERLQLNGKIADQSRQLDKQAKVIGAMRENCQKIVDIEGMTFAESTDAENIIMWAKEAVKSAAEFEKKGLK